MSASERYLSLGDSLYVDGDYPAACDAYASSLDAEAAAAGEGGGDGCAAVPPASSVVARFRSLSHRGAARLAMGHIAEALGDAESALKLLSSSDGGGGDGLRPGEEGACRDRAGQCRARLAEEAEAEAGRARAAGAETAAAAARAPPPSPADGGATPAAGPAAVAGTPRKIKPAATPAATPSPRRPTLPTMPKYQYYQSDAVMTISILEPNVSPDDIRVDIGVDTLTVILTKQGVDFTVICGTLYDAVVKDKCKVVHKDEKVLIKLRKKDKHEWNELFGSGAQEVDKAEGEGQEGAETENGEKADDDAAAEDGNKPAPAPTVDSSKPRAYASHRDWDAIERDLKKQEEKETPEGEEALNKLFRDIYGKADEDTRRAMVKSFQTSGGTVLSTNWDEVSKTDYEKERQAPKGMEWKDRDGNRLPQKDD